jgi:hypothetical protein
LDPAIHSMHLYRVTLSAVIVLDVDLAA